MKRDLTNDEIIKFIQIAYNTMKVKFIEIEKNIENISIDITNKRIRVLILDLTYIFNHLYGFSISSIDFRRPDIIFDEEFINQHCIEILNLIAHYRRFFYYHLKTEIDYIFIFRSLNMKQQLTSYKKIIKNLEIFSEYIPDLYINTIINNQNIFIKEIFNNLIIQKYESSIDIKTYIFSPDDILKSIIYSFSNKYFLNDNQIVESQYYQNKSNLIYFENKYEDYISLFYNKNELLRKKFKENYYKLLLLEQVSTKLRLKRKNTKAKLYYNIFIENVINLEKLVSKEEYELFLNNLTKLELVDSEIQRLIINLIKIKTNKLYDHKLININNLYSKTELNIEWLLRSK